MLPQRMTNALPAGTPIERLILHGGGEDVPPLKGTTLVPWSRVAEFARDVFAGGPTTTEPASKKKAAAKKAAARKSVKRVGAREKARRR